MKSVAFVTLALIAIGSSAHAAVQVTFEVEQIEPKLGTVRQIVLTRTSERCLVWSVGPTDDQLCIFAPQGTLLAERSEHLQKFIPYSEATMRAPEATGRTRYLPPLSGGILTWEPIYEIPGNRGKVFFDPGELSEKGSHTRQLAEIDKDSEGNVTRVATRHNGVRETIWEFEDFQLADRWQVPVEITRKRYRASGLNIPADDVVRWHRVSIRTVPDSTVDDYHLFSNGAAITDFRPEGFGRTATYQRANGPLDGQWKDRASSSPSQSQSPDWPKLLLGSCLGAGLAIVAVVRNTSPHVRDR